MSAILITFGMLGFIGWVVAQARLSRKPVWDRRFMRLALIFGPIVRNVIADVRAVRRDIHVWRFQRKLNRRWDRPRGGLWD